MAASIAVVFLAIFYFLILFFALSDFKRFVFHIHISRVDRTPVTIDIDSSNTSTSLWYPIIFGIIFNFFICLFSIGNLVVLLRQDNCFNRLNLFTLTLLVLFTIRLIVNNTLTKKRNGLATPTLVERSFFAPSLSLEEELATLIFDYFIKFVGFICTFAFVYQLKQEQTMSIERRHETKLMSSFD